MSAAKFKGEVECARCLCRRTTFCFAGLRSLQDLLPYAWELRGDEMICADCIAKEKREERKAS